MEKSEINRMVAQGFGADPEPLGETKPEPKSEGKPKKKPADSGEEGEGEGG